MQVSDKDKRILGAALEAGQYRLSVEGVAQKADVPVADLRKRLKDPQFHQLFIETMQSGLLVDTPEILEAFVTEAKAGSFRHGKLILEITGIYSEKKQVNLGGKLEIGESPFGSDEERRAFLLNTLKDDIKGASTDE